MVLSLNEATGRLEPHRVLALLDMGVKPVYRITTASGKSLKTTLTHPYLTPEGWKRLEEIRVGEEVAVAEDVVSGTQGIKGGEMAFLRGRKQSRAHIRADKDGVKLFKFKSGGKNNGIAAGEVVAEDKLIGLNDISRGDFNNSDFIQKDIFAEFTENGLKIYRSYFFAVFNPIKSGNKFCQAEVGNNNLGVLFLEPRKVYRGYLNQILRRFNRL